MKKLQFCLVLFSVLLLALSTAAQIQNGQLTGDITDPSGAAITGAKVVIKNQATQLTTTASSNQQGHFVFNQVAVGTYSVTVTAQNFKSETHTNLVVDPGSITHSDFKMQVGSTSEVVEVTGAAPAVDTESSQLSQIVSGAQVAGLPLNGRNVYDLIQMAPGAVNVNGVDFENGHGTVVNGLREDFNGFLINGTSNKGLSGGVNNVPIQDTVEEFQQLGLNNSAQYGSSAGSITNLVTKSGTNSWHGSGWEFLRNDKLDANYFFNNYVGLAKQQLRFNQFGGTFGGPIIKDKLFFFVSYQQDHFNTQAPPVPILVESPQFRQAVIDQLPNSTAALLFKNFAPAVNGDCDITHNGVVTWEGAVATEGVTGIPYIDSAFAALDASPLLEPGVTPLLCKSIAVFGQQTQTFGNLFQGKEASGRIDYDPNEKNRFFVNFNWLRNSDNFGPCTPACTRGFTNPTHNVYPTGTITWDHTFTPSIINEARVGYTGFYQLIGTGLPGVPSIVMDDGASGFGS